MSLPGRFVKALAMVMTAIVLFLGVQVAQAIDAPDNPMSLEDVDGFTGILETGDLLIVAEYVIPYSTIPTDFRADQSFVFHIRDSAGTIVATNTPYPYNEDGYNRGIVSAYLSAADVTGAGFTWPFSANAMQVQLIGNPTIFTTQPEASQSLGASHFQGTDDADTNETALETLVVSKASILQTVWGVTLLTGANLLSNTGAQYFQLAIPGLISTVDSVFSISTEAPIYPTLIPTPIGYASTASDRYAANLVVGTDAGTSFGSLETDTGISAQFWKGMLFLSAVIGFVALAGARLGGGAAVGALGFSGIVGLPIALDQGFVAWAFGAMVIASIVTVGFVRIFHNVVSDT